MCCCSFMGQLLYGAIMVATLGLTLGAMFSSGWSEVKNQYGFDVFDYAQHPKRLFSFLCGSDSMDARECRDYFEHLPAWTKAVVILMCISVIVEVIAILWTLFTICACCCKRYVIHPLPALALLLVICLAAVLIIFGVNNHQDIESLRNGYTTKLGYSFYLACGSLAGAIIDIIVGGLTVALAEKNW